MTKLDDFFFFLPFAELIILCILWLISSLKEQFMIWNEPLTTGELQLLLHKFKCYLSSVGRKSRMTGFPIDHTEVR